MIEAARFVNAFPVMGQENSKSQKGKNAKFMPTNIMLPPKPSDLKGASAPARRPVTMTAKSPLRSGWILVVGLLGLCVLGTWLTSRNYHAQVVTSTSATVLQNQWPESRIAAEFPAGEVARLRPGMVARITVGTDKTLIPGRVFSIDSGRVVIAVSGDAGNVGRSPEESAKNHHYLPAGASCAVTVDMTIPPEALASPSPR